MRTPRRVRILLDGLGALLRGDRSSAWTPRRVLLLLGGIVLFVGAYGVYARVLGWLDGLPQIPERMLRPSDGTFRPPDRPTSPTVERLREAFGPDCPEQDSAFYPTQLEFRNGGSSIVLAAGATPLAPGTNRITLSPFSIAIFGKARPEHFRQPGEAVEISTFHSDKAVLEFDRPINNPNDMNRAKLLRLELVSDPEQALPDRRRGKVHITNNQRSTDPNKCLVLRTQGPVFYRDPKGAGPPTSAGPDIWTDAAIEIVDRQNLPRAYDAPAPPTAPARGEVLRAPGALPEILAGSRLPPPTISAVGMRIFLEPDGKQASGAAPDAPKKGGAFSGVRRVELLEKVLFNLWVDARQGFVSAPGGADPDRKGGGGNPLAPVDPPAAAAGVVGGSFFAAQTARRLDRALLQIETLGPFAYDVKANVARFDVVPQADPNLPNDVQVTRIPPRGGQQRLFSQVLEIEFSGPPTRGRPAPDPANQPPGSAFKRLHAWAYTPGRYLTVSSDDDRLEAFGNDLVYDQAANRTTLEGAPLYAVRTNEPREDGKPSGGNVLTAGAAQRPATLVMEPGTAKETVTTVRGPGQIELFDPATGANTLRATWQTSLVHAKEVIHARQFDLLTFTGGAKFADEKSDYWLRGNVLKLWIEGGGTSPDGRTPDRGQALPHRLQAVGEVSSHSAEFVVERADHLNVLFRDVPPPPAPNSSAPAEQPPAAGSPGRVAGAGPAPGPPPKDPGPKPKPPTKLRGRMIDTWVVRYPVPSGAKLSGTLPAEEKDRAPAGRAGVSLKYDLERARCEGTVVVHQDPTDPEKPRGLDIFGDTVLVDHTPDGSVLTVTGTEAKLGEVHHEGNSIIGPHVVIDQIHNRVVVEGRGSLVMPAGSTLNGREFDPRAGGRRPPAAVVVHWRDGMEFKGATKTAAFFGRVRAVQNESDVVCHTMQVVFDRPVYFSQFRTANDPPAPRPPRAGPGSNSPKIEMVYCYPAPEDAPDEPQGANSVAYNDVIRDVSGKMVKSQHVTARELVLTANARDGDRGEAYQKVEAHGPGIVRIWQPGQKDIATAPPSKAPTPGTAPAPKPDESEMKLTIVQFSGRMTAKDKAKVYQEVVFQTDQGGAIEVIHAPADAPGAQVDRHHLPQGAVRLTCADRLEVSSYKRANAPPTQRMDAYGNAYIRSDEYDGWGEKVTADGRYVVLHGRGNTLARIYSRFKMSGHSGKTITYDRVTGGYKVDGSFGGTIETPPPAPPPEPPKQ